MSNSNMDPFDEFEFKPLTDGLGFHKKTVSLKDDLKKSGVLDDELQPIPVSVPKGLLEEEPVGAPFKKHSFEDVLSALEKTPLQRKGTAADLQFTEPLPREARMPVVPREKEVPRAPAGQPQPSQSPFPQRESYKKPASGTPAAKAEQANAGTRRGAADSPAPERKLVPAILSMPSAFLDFVIVTALSIVFLVVLLTVTNVDLNVVIRNLSRDFMTQLAMGIMFIAVMQMYVVISRSFFGATLGEWTFDLQIGEDRQCKLESYPLRVALRSLIVTGTGLILLPLISALLRRDIAGSISGVKLYRQII